MKKLLTAIFTGFAIIALCAFAGCGDDDRSRQKHDEIEQKYSICYAFTASSDVLTITDSTTMKDYMDALKADGKLLFEGSDGDYGFYITSVLGIGSLTISSTANSYSGYDWAVYTTLTSIDGVIYSADDSTFVYDGITLYKASYGVSGLPCVDGESYALVYEYSEMSW